MYLKSLKNTRKRKRNTLFVLWGLWLNNIKLGHRYSCESQSSDGNFCAQWLNTCLMKGMWQNDYCHNSRKYIHIINVWLRRKNVGGVIRLLKFQNSEYTEWRNESPFLKITQLYSIYWATTTDDSKCSKESWSESDGYKWRRVRKRLSR